MDYTVNRHVDTPVLDKSFASASAGEGALVRAELDERLKILANIDLLLDSSLAQYKQPHQINTPEAEKDICEKLMLFFRACGFHGAEDRFSHLLAIKSGKRERRSDGTFSPYHEIIPILYALAFVKMGKDASGIDLENLEKHGGLETWIETIIDHDYVEDAPVTWEMFYRSKLTSIERFSIPLSQEQPSVFTAERVEREMQKAERVINNVRFVTSKEAALDENGRIIALDNGKWQRRTIFETASDFIHNMVDAEDANPIPFIVKQADVAHNTATIEGAKKYADPKIRFDICNDREDIYGAREAAPDKAIKRWPEYEKAFSLMDCTLGAGLYLELQSLKYVDLLKPDRYQPGGTIRVMEGLHRYLNKALSVPVPNAFNMFHIALERKQTRALNEPQAEEFLQKAVYPVLKYYKGHFPERFMQGPPTEPKDTLVIVGGGANVTRRETLAPIFQ